MNCFWVPGATDLKMTFGLVKPCCFNPLSLRYRSNIRSSVRARRTTWVLTELVKLRCRDSSIKNRSRRNMSAKKADASVARVADAIPVIARSRSPSILAGESMSFCSSAASSCACLVERARHPSMVPRDIDWRETRSGH